MPVPWRAHRLGCLEDGKNIGGLSTIVKIVYAASEIVPFASTGGLAEVGAALPLTLAERGVEFIRIMPLYRQVAEGGFEIHDTGIRLDVPVGFRMHKAEVWMTQEQGPSTYFIRKDEFFDRSQLYSLPERDYDDNLERFVFFQKAVVALIDSLNLKPDIVHCSDWQTGLVPLFLRHGIQGMGRDQKERTVFTIHNLAYQGIFPGSQYSVTNLPFFCFTVDTLEFYGNINCMKAGITTANAVTTVSKTYAREIRTEEYGCGLQGVLDSIGDRMVGIINGADYATWDPARDPFLAQTFSADDLTGKRACKKDLIQVMGLGISEQTPLIGMVSRLVNQKGLDILAEAMPSLMELDIGLVLLGVGQEHYHVLCKEWMKRWPSKVAVSLDYNIGLAHKIDGGADISLVPSRFEPCGLHQLYSLRYGAVPIVHATGGLDDTIIDLSHDGQVGTGVKFKTYSAEALMAAILKAVEMYHKPDAWSTIVKRAMEQDFSWERAADEYLMLYHRVVS